MFKIKMAEANNVFLGNVSEANNVFLGNVSFQNFLLFIFIVILTFVLGSLLNILITRFLKEKVKPVIYKTISKIAMYGVYALGLYFAFVKIISFNIPAGLAALGILGIALLLPAVPVLQNIAAGIVITLERPFREEDIVEIDGTLCKVKDIMLRKTRLRSLDGKIIIVPNLSFITSNIINYSKGEFIKVVLDVDITLDSNKEKTAEILKKICYDNPNILPNVPKKKLNFITQFFALPRNLKILNPKVMVKSVNKEKISLEVWFWIWDILMKEHIISSFYKKLIEEFKKEKIKFG